MPMNNRKLIKKLIEEGHAEKVTKKEAKEAHGNTRKARRQARNTVRDPRWDNR